MAAGANEGETDPRSNQVYGANLIGSAMGSLASLLVLDAVGGEGAVMATVMLASVSGLLFGLAAAPFGSGKRKECLLTAVAGLVIIGSLSLILKPQDQLAQRLSPYKTLSILGQAYDARHTVTAWDATARADVIETVAAISGIRIAAERVRVVSLIAFIHCMPSLRRIRDSIDRAGAPGCSIRLPCYRRRRRLPPALNWRRTRGHSGPTCRIGSRTAPW